ncbi:arginine biosynthesis protein ArgJ [Chloroflexia bacterium SDU3-3]|nr:arginine biosynthesis protein ArgJ [Chloroflexia bacterium SDU3-3]
MSYRIIDEGHVSTPQGYRATGVSCGLKEVKARDLAMVYSAKPARVAAIFTTNTISAAPIFFNQAVLARNRESLRAVVINAGHANVATGSQGLANAVECAKMSADELEVPRDSVLLLSTGRIGLSLPMEKMREGIRRAASELDSGGGRRAATAILTTDTRPKDSAISVSLREGRSIVIGGMAKGSRMVYPRQGTLLCVLTSDVAIDGRLLSRSLEQAVAGSFGRLALDSDISPNDGILLFANGASDVPMITDASSWEYGAWQEGLDAICADLAVQVARDSLAGGKLIQIHVRSAADEQQAQKIAHAISRSAAVRWACAQNIADWGSILVAVGASGADLRPDLLEIRLGNVLVLREGVAEPFDTAAAVQALSGAEIELTVELHLGTHAASVWTGTAE